MLESLACSSTRISIPKKSEIQTSNWQTLMQFDPRFAFQNFQLERRFAILDVTLSLKRNTARVQYSEA